MKIDSLPNRTLDTLYHKIELVSTTDGSSFFTLENPLWYLLTLIAGGFITFFFANRQKKKDSITEAKKILLEKKIAVYDELFKQCSIGKTSSSPQTDLDKYYYRIYGTYKTMMEWYDKFLNYSSENNQFLSSDLLKEISLINNLRFRINATYKENNWSDNDLKAFAIKHHDELMTIMSRLSSAISNFYEKEMTLTHKVAHLTDKDYKSIEKRLGSYKLHLDLIRQK